MQRMIIKSNKTALDVVFDVSGSLAGYTAFLYQLPKGERVGFDSLPYLVDVEDIGQTWTPDIEDLDLTFTLKVYNDEAIKKAPFGTDILGLQAAITWGEAIIPSMFVRDAWITFPATINSIPNELKHYVSYNQTLIDVAFDMSGTLSVLQALMNQLPDGLRLGFDDRPEIWEDTINLGQTWTPNVENQYFEINANVLDLRTVKKKPFATDLLGLAVAVSWGNAFLQGIITEGDYMVDENFDFMVDEIENYITT